MTCLCLSSPGIKGKYYHTCHCLYFFLPSNMYVSSVSKLFEVTQDKWLLLFEGTRPFAFQDTSSLGIFWFLKIKIFNNIFGFNNFINLIINNFNNLMFFYQYKLILRPKGLVRFQLNSFRKHRTRTLCLWGGVWSCVLSDETQTLQLNFNFKISRYSGEWSHSGIVLLFFQQPFSEDDGFFTLVNSVVAKWF